jgi:hypothetical protein
MTPDERNAPTKPDALSIAKSRIRAYIEAFERDGTRITELHGFWVISSASVGLNDHFPRKRRICKNELWHLSKLQ